jgi:hypothetical protein
MKIINTNNNELYIRDGGAGTLVGGLLFAVIATGVLLWMFTKPDVTMIARGVIGLFAIVGLVMAVTASKREVTLRKVGNSEIKTTMLMLRRVKVIGFPSDQIVSIGFESHDGMTMSSSSADGNQNPTRTRQSHVWVTLRDTSQIPLFSATKAVNSVGIGIGYSGSMRAPLYDEANSIATFYGVPLAANQSSETLAGNIAIVADTVRQLTNQAPVQPMTLTPTQATHPISLQTEPAQSLGEQAVVPPVATRPISTMPQSEQPLAVFGRPTSAPVGRDSVQVPPRQ